MNTEVYSIITNRVIRQLENGVVAWREMWRGGESPRNLISRQPYRGVNLLLLGTTAFTSPYWLTFNQVQSLNGRVRKGAKSELVVFWKTFTQTTDNETDRDFKRPPVLRYYHLFNLEQTEGIEPPHLPEQTAEQKPFTPLERAERVIEAMPHLPPIQYDEPRAFYSPAKDFVNLSPPEAFYSPEDYYAVAFHELTHATGHQTRLNRVGVASSSALAPFGSPDYSREELVAELGSAFLCAETGITTTLENSAAYIQSWLDALKADARLIVTAASAAQAACDFILNRHPAAHHTEEGS